MSKNKKHDSVHTEEKTAVQENVVKKPSIGDLEWTEYVLGLLSDDEKISGNPTTDGLRRVFEEAMSCKIISSNTQVVQSPSPDNEKRATVVHSLTYVLNPGHQDKPDLNTVCVDGAADVYWGNCDKIYRNHPVAVAETRAEGRALRRALRLRKVVAAEELAQEIEDHPDSNTVSKITNNQINFVDVMAQRLNINVSKVLESNGIKYDNVYDMPHEDAVKLIRMLSKYQQDISLITQDLFGYATTWKE
jgi:hypothetical protein